MKKIILMTVAALMATTISAETKKALRIMKGDAVAYSIAIDDIDSIVFAEIPPMGTIDGKFSVAEGKQVRFAKGNLQYQASTGTWRFAPMQFLTIGSDNIYISGTYDGWIDLFGWGTGNAPTKSTTNIPDYATFTDWGKNTIQDAEESGWRTLRIGEWYHLLNSRPNADKLIGAAMVGSALGYVLLPDNWTLPAGLTFTARPNDWVTNTYTTAEWSQMEAAGAVFLPTTGFRDGGTISSAPSCYYWSTSIVDAYSASAIQLTIRNDEPVTITGAEFYYYYGVGVRLVLDVE